MTDDFHRHGHAPEYADRFADVLWQNSSHVLCQKSTFRAKEWNAIARIAPANLSNFSSRTKTICAPTWRRRCGCLRHGTIKELLAIDGTGRGDMVSISAKFFEFVQPRPQSNELMTDERFQVWLREQNQATGVNLLAAPQVMSRSGQRAMVEITREVISPEIQETPRTEDVDWQGLWITLEPVVEGEAIRLVGAVDLRLPVDRKTGQLLAEGMRAGATAPVGEATAPVGELTTTATDFEGIVPDGQTALFSINDGTDGPHVVVAMTVNRLDASGQKVGP